MSSLIIRILLLPPMVACFLATADCAAKDEKAAQNKPDRTDLYGDPLPPGAIARLGTVRLRHNSPVYSLCFSPNGRTIASSCSDGRIHLWEVSTGREIGQLGEARDFAGRWDGDGAFLVYSPDGKTIAAVGSRLEGIELWDLATRSSTVLGGDARTFFSAFSPDGKLLAEKSDGFLRLWDLSTGKIVRKLEDRQTGIAPPAYGLAFSPDSKIVATAGTDVNIRLWDVATGNPLRQLQGHKQEVTALAFTPDGKTLVSAGWDETVRAWEVNTGKEIRRFKGHEGRVYSAVISPDGKTVCTGGEDHTVRLWEMATARELKRFSIRSPNVLPIAFSPDGKLIAAGGYDGIIHLWDPSTGKEVSPVNGKMASVGYLAFLPGRKSLISKSWRDDEFTFWNPLTGQEKKEKFQLGRPEDWEISKDGKTLAMLESSPSKEGKPIIRIWDFDQNREIRRLEQTFKKVNALELSADGALVAVAGESTVQIWNVSTGKEVRTVGGNLGSDDKWLVESLTISPNGSILVMKRRWNSVLIINGINPRIPSEMYFWDLSTGKKLDRFDQFKKWCDWVVFSPDGKTMITTAEHSQYHLCFWEAATAKQIRSVENEKMYLCAQFSPDGRALATGLEDGTVLLWEVLTGQIRRSLKGHRGPVYQLAFSDDGHLLASECSDGTALVWDAFQPTSQEGTAPP